ncbi:MAG: InlB B-repeat-containing protein [Clostridia bacterium]|nr:InlB B-repeat-containing protein [Clostridia bacterium]
MGDTKATRLTTGIKFSRLITAALAGVFFFILLTQIVVFPNIKISFYTGAGAQQLEALQIKRGDDVELPTPLKPGSCFLGWSLTPSGGDLIKSSKGIAQSKTLYAVWDGAEKYAVLSVNGIQHKEINIFDTRNVGLTSDDLTRDWCISDDYHTAQNLKTLGTTSSLVNPVNNYSRFLGWQYLNAVGSFNDLLFDATTSKWTFVERNAAGIEIRRTQIDDVNKFYPPNYRTTFNAILDYRTLYIKFYDRNPNSLNSLLLKPQKIKLGETISFPVFTQEVNPNAQFSHWEVQISSIWAEYFDDNKNPELASLLKNVKTRYESGEVLQSLDPLLYYWTSELLPLSGGTDDIMVAPLTVRAVYWDDINVHKYSIQTYTDTNAENQNKESISFADVGYDNLSLTSPVALEDNSLWFFDDKNIYAYTFYDHKGKYHEIKTADLQGNTGFNLGEDANFMGDDISFNDQWAVNIKVIYQSSRKEVSVQFNLGEDLYILPDYKHQSGASNFTQTYKIGQKVVLPNAECYMKTDYLFAGWEKVGDSSRRLYSAGEIFVIQNLKINDEPVIEFNAVWRLQRLLFNFNTNGGEWESEVNFNSMKGTYGNSVKVIQAVPEKFGYDFIGWTFEQSHKDSDTLLQPGDNVLVENKIQTLYAQWKPKRLRVAFYAKNTYGELKRFSFKETDAKEKKDLITGGYVELDSVLDNYVYSFDGWQIDGSVLAAGEVLCLNVENLKKLETVSVRDNRGSLLEVRIYAAQTTNTIRVEYKLETAVTDFENVLIDVDVNKLETQLVQGELFYNYYPFSIAKENGSYNSLDSNGREFICWSYSDGTKNVAIDKDTKIPTTKNKITLYGEFSKTKKEFKVEYHSSLNESFISDSNVYKFGEINNKILLKVADGSVNFPIYNANGEKFVGWGLEPDSLSGNPALVYFCSDDENYLTLANTTIVDQYLIDIDYYAKKDNTGKYTLKLYAIYANDHITVTYYYLRNGTNQHTKLKLPVYRNNNFNETAFGGSTVDVNSEFFAAYGNSVLDHTALVNYQTTRAFIGWKASVPNKPAGDPVKVYFESKLWFPGEYLPAIDFDLEFEPCYCNLNDKIENIEGYIVLGIKNIKQSILVNENVDIVAFPSGSYTLSAGQVIINSNREVRVILPATGNIVLEPRAIQCNTIKEFYISDNLSITGSPVIGNQFEAYRVQKGYRVINDDSLSEVLNPSSKYDYVSSTKGLLVSQDCTFLYGVPSHINLNSDELFNLLNNLSIKRIASYALSDLRLSKLNLGFNLEVDQEFTIEDYAIFNGEMSHIILPSSQQSSQKINISAQAFAGTLNHLETVTFGDDTTTRTRYAFVQDSIVYYVDDMSYPNALTHVMYVIPTVKLDKVKLDYLKGNLYFEKSVQKIEPYALMACDWNNINCVMAENEKIDLRGILGVPNNIPVFINVNNIYKNDYENPFIQSYKKNFVFSFNGQDEIVEYVYGQTFKVFDAQNNNNFKFDKEWCQFVGWNVTDTNNFFYVGETYKVGISEAIQGDKFTVRFDASRSDCWQYYPVQFYIFDGTTNVSYFPNSFVDSFGTQYTLDDLIKYYNYLGNIYLPGVNKDFTTPEGDTYQFIGWKTSPTTPNDFDSLMWNNVDIKDRILPNKTAKTELNSGVVNYLDGSKIYKYYALYEKVTSNLVYELLNDKTYAVTGVANTTITSLNIPFAKYYNGFMLPVSTIKANAFSNTLKSTSLSEVVIGGAVSEIEQMAFKCVNIKKLVFVHKSRGIVYNAKQALGEKQLTIGREAFANNESITNLVLPVALKTLQERAFQSCINLVEVKFQESVDLPAINSIGNFVFRDDKSMVSNALIDLILSDGKNGNNNFVTVGDGIFMNTNINDVRDSNGQRINRIVWKGKLLYVYYTGNANDYIFNESSIAGYAFVNAGSVNNPNLKCTLRFTNADVKINANAFSFLHNSIDKIYMKHNNSYVKTINVDMNAFDNTINHSVYVYVNNVSAWNQAFKPENRPLNRYLFVS